MGADPILFTLDDDGSSRDPILRGESAARLEAGLLYCARCPVTKECGDAASPDDRLYTTRGGHAPRHDDHRFSQVDIDKATRAWEGYRRGEKLPDLYPPSRIWFKRLREAYMASAESISWPLHKVPGTRNYRDAGTGIVLSYSPESDEYKVMVHGGRRWDRHTIAGSVVSKVPV